MFYAAILYWLYVHHHSLILKTRITKESITNETLKIEAMQTANSKIESTITSLQGTQRAWLAKKQQECRRAIQMLSNG